jgi:hypothetical protein
MTSAQVRGISRDAAVARHVAALVGLLNARMLVSSMSCARGALWRAAACRHLRPVDLNQKERTTQGTTQGGDPHERRDVGPHALARLRGNNN